MVRGPKKEEMQVERLESQLQRSLRPVQPDPQFVGHLHTRLNTPVALVVERRQNTALGMLLLAISLLSGFTLLLLLRQGRRSEEASQQPEASGGGAGGTGALGQPEFAL